MTTANKLAADMTDSVTGTFGMAAFDVKGLKLGIVAGLDAYGPKSGGLNISNGFDFKQS